MIQGRIAITSSLTSSDTLFAFFHRNQHFLMLTPAARSDLLKLATVHLKGGSSQAPPSVSKAPSLPRGGNGGPDDAEALALRLGQSRVQLGLNLPAWCTPNARAGTAVESGPEDVVLYFGIIDILQVG